MLHSTLPKNVGEFGLAISKLILKKAYYWFKMDLCKEHLKDVKQGRCTIRDLEIGMKNGFHLSAKSTCGVTGDVCLVFSAKRLL